MHTRATRCFFLLVLVAVLPACKLAVIVDEGGDVAADTTGFDCEEFSNCVFIVEDTSFRVAFTAEPKTGFEFSHWQGGPGYLCPGSPNPTCVLDASIPGLEDEIASDKTYSLRPVFQPIQAEAGSGLVLMDSDPGGSKTIGDVVGFDGKLPTVRVKAYDVEVLLEGATLLGVVGSPANSSQDIFFDQPDCEGQAFLFEQPTYLSNTIARGKLLTRNDLGGTRELWVVRPETPAQTYRALSIRTAGFCSPWLTDFRVEPPAELLVNDFNALFPPPYRLEPQ